MEAAFFIVGALSIAGVVYASAADLHRCAHCGSTGSEEYGMMQKLNGKRTLFSPLGTYWIHTSCMARVEA